MALVRWPDCWKVISGVPPTFIAACPKQLRGSVLMDPALLRRYLLYKSFKAAMALPQGISAWRACRRRRSAIAGSTH